MESTLVVVRLLSPAASQLYQYPMLRQQLFTFTLACAATRANRELAQNTFGDSRHSLHIENLWSPKTPVRSQVPAGRKVCCRIPLGLFPVIARFFVGRSLGVHACVPESSNSSSKA